jgi:hypothetical protein
MCNPQTKEGEASRAPTSENRYFFAVAADSFRPGATTGFRNGIIARSFRPICSICCCCSALRRARKFGQPF